MRRGLALLGLTTALATPGLTQTSPHAPVTNRERDSFGNAVARGELDALRAIIGPHVMLTDGNADFQRSSPEALIAATRGCRLIEASRTGTNPDMWYLFACPGRPRGARLRAWEDPGIYIKLWHHPAGMLASFWYPGPVEVRRRPRGSFAPPSPPAPPRRRNP
jgi:hypothetical protein